MENINPLDIRQEDAQQGGHSQVQQPIKREIDSLDDFEHLGHDNSPLKEEQKTEDLFVLHAESPAGEINKGVELATKAATEFTDDFVRNFDRPAGREEEGSLVDNKMDSNLLQMGDTLLEKGQNEEKKVDKLLGEFSPSKNNEKPEEYLTKEKEIGDFKSATQDFVNMEREFIQTGEVDVLDRYSNTKQEEEQVKHSSKNDDLQTSTFKADDVQEVESLISWLPEKATEVTPKSVALPEKAVPESKQEIRKEPDFKKTDAVAPKVEKYEPEPRTKKPVSDIIEVEAVFCKIGLGEFSVVPSM